MHAGMMLVAAATIGLFCTQPARADDCDDAMKRIEDVTEIAGKTMELEMTDLTKNKPQGDQELAALKNRLCSAFGEFLGVARVTRLASDECLSGNKRRATINSLDASIKQMEDSILKTCQ
jgi:hypothetical protein